MDQLSTARTADVSAFIGALEMTGTSGVGDAQLEAASGLAPTPTQPASGASVCRTRVFCVDDGALEAASGMAMAGPTTPVMGCFGTHPHGDDVLESAGATALNPTKFQCGMYPTHRCHSDDMLEAAGGATVAGPTVPQRFGCVADDVLEAAGGVVGAGPTSMNAGCRNSVFVCADDGALEAVAGKHAAGPMTRRIPNYPACV